LYREEPIFAMQTLAPLVLPPPCPRIVPAPLIVVGLHCSFRPEKTSLCQISQLAG